ncbi:MAG: hypothetical protein GXO49_03870 [Chlorobi bacterium]|nr:hypothetical protein [Chlorobiota bacterium]
MKYVSKITTLLIIVIFIIQSCNKDDFITDANAKLQFSKDTVFFDTVFNGVGSATRYFIVYNPHSSPINISNIELAKGTSSKYRLNINGNPTNFAENIEIAAEDSMFIFVDVQIDTNTDNIIEEDQVVFNTNNNLQAVNLLAFGQNVHLLNDSVINSQTWTNDKPYVIFNSMALNENETLNIEAGAKIYSHRDSRIIILGTLNVNGTFDEPVIFDADRLNGHSSIFFDNDSTDNYDDVAGQWGGIWLTKLSKNNNINFANINNAVIGIQVDSVGQENSFQLKIHNTKIEHHSYAGILAIESSIFASNCLLTDCGYYNLAITRGGSYEFYHTTFGNYWNAPRQTPAIYLNNYFKYDETIYIYQLEKAYFGNCIIWGSNDTEIGIEQHEAGDIFNYTFENSIIKVDKESDIDISDNEHFINTINNNDPLFTDYYEYNFTLQENSSAINSGAIEITNLYPEYLCNDLNNETRISDDAPDCGCYEFK